MNPLKFMRGGPDDPYIIQVAALIINFYMEHVMSYYSKVVAGSHF